MLNKKALALNFTALIILAIVVFVVIMILYVSVFSPELSGLGGTLSELIAYKGGG